MTQEKLYGVSVGPGDPELLTIKAARILREADCIAVPNIGHGRQTALDIVAQYIDGKPLIDCSTPMSNDYEIALRAYKKIADDICGQLEQGKSVAYAVLGDACVYSTYIYVHDIVRERGFQAEIIPGVTSFCAAAAKLNTPLCEGPQSLLVVPTIKGDVEAALDVPAVKVFMKTGKNMGELKEALATRGLLEHACAVANCGLPDEKMFPSLADADECTDYFTVVIAKDPNHTY